MRCSLCAYAAAIAYTQQHKQQPKQAHLQVEVAALLAVLGGHSHAAAYTQFEGAAIPDQASELGKRS